MDQLTVPQFPPLGVVRITPAPVLPAVLDSCVGISNWHRQELLWLSGLCLALSPDPNSSFSLCSCGPAGVGATPLRTALPTHTQVDRPGCIAGVTQLGSPRAGKGKEESRGSHWGIQGGLPGPAPLPLLARPVGASALTDPYAGVGRLYMGLRKVGSPRL